MKRFTVLVFLLAALALSSCVKEEEVIDGRAVQSLKLTLNLDQSTYHVGEPVIATITVENTGNQVVVINSRMSVNLPFMSSPVREMAFIVFTPSGENYWPNANYTPRGLKSEYFVDLLPGKKFEIVIHLKSLHYEFNEIGVYKIIANYQNSVDPSFVNPEDARVAWKGDLNSNEVLLTIIP